MTPNINSITSNIVQPIIKIKTPEQTPPPTPPQLIITKLLFNYLDEDRYLSWLIYESGISDSSGKISPEIADSFIFSPLRSSQIKNLNNRLDERITKKQDDPEFPIEFSFTCRQIFLRNSKYCFNTPPNIRFCGGGLPPTLGIEYFEEEFCRFINTSIKTTKISDPKTLMTQAFRHMINKEANDQDFQITPQNSTIEKCRILASNLVDLMVETSKHPFPLLPKLYTYLKQQQEALHSTNTPQSKSPYLKSILLKPTLEPNSPLLYRLWLEATAFNKAANIFIPTYNKENALPPVDYLVRSIFNGKRNWDIIYVNSLPNRSLFPYHSLAVDLDDLVYNASNSKHTISPFTTCSKPAQWLSDNNAQLISSSENKAEDLGAAKIFFANRSKGRRCIEEKTAEKHAGFIINHSKQTNKSLSEVTISLIRQVSVSHFSEDPHSLFVMAYNICCFFSQNAAVLDSEIEKIWGLVHKHIYLSDNSAASTISNQFTDPLFQHILKTLAIDLIPFKDIHIALQVCSYISLHFSSQKRILPTQDGKNPMEDVPKPAISIRSLPRELLSTKGNEPMEAGEEKGEFWTIFFEYEPDKALRQYLCIPSNEILAKFTNETINLLLPCHCKNVAEPSPLAPLVGDPRMKLKEVQGLVNEYFFSNDSSKVWLGVQLMGVCHAQQPDFNLFTHFLKICCDKAMQKKSILNIEKTLDLLNNSLIDTPYKGLFNNRSQLSISLIKLLDEGRKKGDIHWFLLIQALFNTHEPDLCKFARDLCNELEGTLDSRVEEKIQSVLITSLLSTQPSLALKCLFKAVTLPKVSINFKFILITNFILHFPQIPNSTEKSLARFNLALSLEKILLHPLDIKYVNPKHSLKVHSALMTFILELFQSGLKNEACKLFLRLVSIPFLNTNQAAIEKVWLILSKEAVTSHNLDILDKLWSYALSIGLKKLLSPQCQNEINQDLLNCLFNTNISKEYKTSETIVNHLFYQENLSKLLLENKKPFTDFALKVISLPPSVYISFFTAITTRCHPNNIQVLIEILIETYKEIPAANIYASGGPFLLKTIAQILFSSQFKIIFFKDLKKGILQHILDHIHHERKSNSNIKIYSEEIFRSILMFMKEEKIVAEMGCLFNEIKSLNNNLVSYQEDIIWWLEQSNAFLDEVENPPRLNEIELFLEQNGEFLQSNPKFNISLAYAFHIKIAKNALQMNNPAKAASELIHISKTLPLPSDSHDYNSIRLEAMLQIYKYVNSVFNELISITWNEDTTTSLNQKWNAFLSELENEKNPQETAQTLLRIQTYQNILNIDPTYTARLINTLLVIKQQKQKRKNEAAVITIDERSLHLSFELVKHIKISPSYCWHNTLEKISKFGSIKLRMETFEYFFQNWTSLTSNVSDEEIARCWIEVIEGIKNSGHKYLTNLLEQQDFPPFLKQLKESEIKTQLSQLISLGALTNLIKQSSNNQKTKVDAFFQKAFDATIFPLPFHCFPEKSLIIPLINCSCISGKPRDLLEAVKLLNSSLQFETKDTLPKEISATFSLIFATLTQLPNFPPELHEETVFLIQRLIMFRVDKINLWHIARLLTHIPGHFEEKYYLVKEIIRLFPRSNNPLNSTVVKCLELLLRQLHASPHLDHRHFAVYLLKENMLNKVLTPPKAIQPKGLSNKISEWILLEHDSLEKDINKWNAIREKLLINPRDPTLLYENSQIQTRVTHHVCNATTIFISAVALINLGIGGLFYYFSNNKDPK